MEYLIKTNSIGGLSEEQFFQFCQENSNLKFERNAYGEIIIMAPTGSETGWFNSRITTELALWNKKHKAGFVFDSNTGFTLPNNAVRSPDAAYLKKEKWLLISKEDRKKFAHVCPDFIIELRSESDNINELKEKMKEWINNGCSLAWLIDPAERITFIYRPTKEPELRDFSSPLTGENILPDFFLYPTEIFDTDN
jgi:Uma2 family endonuclease